MLVWNGNIVHDHHMDRVSNFLIESCFAWIPIFVEDRRIYVHRDFLKSASNESNHRPSYTKKGCSYWIVSNDYKVRYNRICDHGTCWCSQLTEMYVCAAKAQCCAMRCFYDLISTQYTTNLANVF